MLLRKKLCTVLDTALKELKNELNNLKQYIKLDNLLFHNLRLPYNYKYMSSLQFSYFIADVINRLITQLATPVTWQNISDVHPLRTKLNKSSVIIVRFCNRNIRHEIYSKRALLKRSGISITEHLTDSNLAVLKKAQELFGFRSVNTENCQVVVDVQGKKKKT